MEKLLSIKKAADFIGVEAATLRRWEKEGVLKPTRTKGGHRRYVISDLEKHVEGKNADYSYGTLYKILSESQHQVDIFVSHGLLEQRFSDLIKEMREEVGRLFLDEYFNNKKK